MRAKEFIAEFASVGGTSAGAVATVSGGLGQTITRNSSIYGKSKKTKKKKYVNSKEKD